MLKPSQFNFDFKNILFILYIFIILCNLNQSIAQSNNPKQNSNKSSTKETTNSIDILLQKLSNSGKKENKNYILFEINYGFSSPSFYNNDINQKFDNINSLDIKYGFYHENRKIRQVDFFKFTNEFVQFGNKSSYMNIFDKINNEYTQEAWVASFGTTDGHGIKGLTLPFLGGYELLLAHSLSLDLNRIDFEQFSTNPNHQAIFNNYDEKYKFGNSFSSSLIFKTNFNIYLRIGYEDRLVFKDFPFFKWGGSYLIDNLALKVPEIYEEELIDKFGNYYPYLLYCYQTLYSLGSYYIKEQYSYFPFKSDVPIRYKGIIIGFSMSFDN